MNQAASLSNVTSFSEAAVEKFNGLAYNTPTITPLSPVASVARDTFADAAVTINVSELKSVIAAGDVFKGEFESANGVRIAGKIMGDVTSQGAVVLESGGMVTGTITAQQVFVDSVVGVDHGNGIDNEHIPSNVAIQCPGLVVLLDGARVYGDVNYGKLATYGDMVHNGRNTKIRSPK